MRVRQLMRPIGNILALALCFCLLLSGCTSAPEQVTEPESVDYAAAVKLDMSSDTAKLEVSVKTFIDGDTVHFQVGADVMPEGVLKGRFLAVNTPESTGKIEEYGKAASDFTRQRLSAASSIVIESETGTWDPDSTGDRYLVWVWYKTDADADYRNLNIELLQNGLAIANSAASNRYGESCVAAIDQAKREKRNLYSGQPDPDYYYGDAIELTLRELRLNTETYSGMKVAFTGTVIANSGSQGVYVEEYDAETDLYFGMYIYYGHGLSGPGLEILSVGNRVRIVGTVQYYEAGGTWQVSDLNYRMMQPDDPGNIQKLGSDGMPAYVLTEPELFAGGSITLPNGDGETELSYAAAVMDTSVRMQGLTVVDVYTTDNPDSSSHGAMTLICVQEDITVTVRTGVLLDADGNRITADAYLGKTIDVQGIVDYFDGTWQIRVLTPDNITIN